MGICGETVSWPTTVYGDWARVGNGNVWIMMEWSSM
jgi:hypothetical protein